MKYTLKQVMAFTAMTYETEIKQINGRQGYLQASNGQLVHQLKHNYMSFAPAVVAFSGGVYLMTANIVDIVSKGFNTASVLAVLTAVFLAVVSVLLFRRYLSIFADYKKNCRDYALGHEPEALWDFKYSQGNNQQAHLIRSLLGARMMLRKMISSTSIPLDNDVIDTKVVHLVKEITKSREGEIHEVIMEEANFFCRQALTQMNFYISLVNFHDDLQKEFRKSA